MNYPILHLAVLGLRACVEYAPDTKQLVYMIQAGPWEKHGVLKEFDSAE